MRHKKICQSRNDLYRRKIMKSKVFTISLSVLATIISVSNSANATELTFHQAPLYLSTSEKANVLVILDNSNSMDEAANGSAVGSASPESKSEIARTAVKSLITSYTGKINMGLMAYQQGSISKYNLDNAPYDISYDINDYDPSFTGDRDSQTKRYRLEKADDSGNYVYYNVALPYYHGGSAPAIGTTNYCFSTTANAFKNDEPVEASCGSGTYTERINNGWDVYSCYYHKNGDSNLTDESAGYINRFYRGLLCATDSDIAQGITDFGALLHSVYIGSTWFSNTSPGRGYLHTPIVELDATQVNKLNVKLGTSQFATNAPTDSTRPLQNAGLTPLQGTLLSAKDYFTGTALPADEGGPVAALSESCGNDYITLLTDGLPSTDASGNLTATPETALTAVASAAQALYQEEVETYMIGFALPDGTDPTTLNAIATAGGTGTAYYANDLANLNNTFSSIFDDILAKTGSSSAAATNANSLSSNSHVYQARFDSTYWSGQLLAKSMSLQGVIDNNEIWDAATQLISKAEDDRVILTYGRDTKDGIPFRWSDINGLTDTTAKDALNTDPLKLTADTLGSDRVDFLRGGTGGTSSAVFRVDRVGKLGDIIQSTPTYVGAPGAGYNDVDMAGYASFLASYSSRTPILYVGANDGMLHGFDAATGEELLAYIPREVYPNLSKLTAQGYGTTALAHHYFVDGAPMIADANVSGWKTILAGGLNEGGQGIYALDITNPSAFAESAASDIVLWEFTDEDDVDLGYTFSQPSNNLLTNQSAQIAKMANGKWAVIIGNGYNNTEADGYVSTTGHAYLYILFINEGIDGTWTLGTDYIKIDTGEGNTTTPNGLATPNPIDIDGDGDIDVVYAGDLLGNMWKFDVSDSVSSNWGISISANKPLFTAKDSSSNVQPITSMPIVTGHPQGGYMVGFGTGKYIELSDISTTGTQTFYGIWDEGVNVPNIARNGLVEQTILSTTTIGSTSYRISSLNPVDYTSSPSEKGWYMDLPESGERVDVNPIIRDGRFVFVTRTPSSATCSAGGTSWLMELDYLTGGHLEISPFDVNGDGSIDNDDFATYTITNDDGTTVDITVPVFGMRDDDGGMQSTPAPIEKDTPGEEFKIMTDNDGQIKTILESADTSYKGRISWEEIR